MKPKALQNVDEEANELTPTKTAKLENSYRILADKNIESTFIEQTEKAFSTATFPSTNPSNLDDSNNSFFLDMSNMPASFLSGVNFAAASPNIVKITMAKIEHTLKTRIFQKKFMKKQHEINEELNFSLENFLHFCRRVHSLIRL